MIEDITKEQWVIMFWALFIVGIIIVILFDTDVIECKRVLLNVTGAMDYYKCHFNLP